MWGDLVRARDGGEGSLEGEDEDPTCEGIVDVGRVDTSGSFAMSSSRELMVDSSRWRVGSSSEGKSARGVGGFSEVPGGLASLRISSSTDLGSADPEYFSGAWLDSLGRADEVMGLRRWIKSEAASLLVLGSSFVPSISDGVGIGRPRPPVGRGVSTHAPVTKGVLRSA